MSRIRTLPWYGGKYSHLPWLLSLLPQVRGYCEPFGGSAAVLVNREPSLIETYNDLDGDLVCFFRTLRDQPDALIREIELTPYSRAEYRTACTARGDETLPDLERARLFFVRAVQCRCGMAQRATIGMWGYSRSTTRRGMAMRTSQWDTASRDLYRIAKRLRRVQIENLPALEVIARYDDPETLIYADPPYVHSTRSVPDVYHAEMSDDDHRELARALNSAQALVAVSGYDCELMDSLYPPPRWTKYYAPEKTLSSSPQRRRRKQEVLWTNYDVPAAVFGARFLPMD